MCYRSDADTEVLADYIIALLKHDGDKKSIRELCEKEIPDFLTEGTLNRIQLNRTLPAFPPYLRLVFVASPTDFGNGPRSC